MGVALAILAPPSSVAHIQMLGSACDVTPESVTMVYVAQRHIAAQEVSGLATRTLRNSALTDYLEGVDFDHEAERMLGLQAWTSSEAITFYTAKASSMGVSSLMEFEGLEQPHVSKAVAHAVRILNEIYADLCPT